MKNIYNALRKKIIKWLSKEVVPIRPFPLSDFMRIQQEIRPCDVLLIEGRTRVSRAIQMLTQSNWSHAALYIGRLSDIKDPEVRAHISRYYFGNPQAQLIIEGLLGQGTIVSPLTRYQYEHIRICRPKGIVERDVQAVINHAAQHLGVQYSVRQLLDLARFIFPWAILPRRWRSSLFNHNTGTPTQEICSSVIAEAFQSVDFPILPALQEKKDHTVEYVQRNPKLYTPSDFDYSPFFEIIKYPMVNLAGAAYRHLPWKTGTLSDDDGTFYMVIDNDNPATKTKGKKSNNSPAALRKNK